MSSNVTDERDDFTLRCPRCQGYDFPGVMHVIGCPNDPCVESMSDPHTAVARLMKADETDDWCELRPEECRTLLSYNGDLLRAAAR